MNQAIALHYSDELEYNRLLFLYKINPKNKELIEHLEGLLKTFMNRETVLLYLHVLCIHSKFEECKFILSKYGDFLDADEKMVISYLCGDYVQGALCFNEIIEQYSLNEIETSMMIECLLRTKKYNEVNKYSKQVLNHEENIDYGDKGKRKNFFDKLIKSNKYRLILISKYKFQPIYIMPCCYFGCTKHI